TRASSVEVEVRGKLIDRAYATWCSTSDGVEATVLTAESDDRVVLEVNVDPNAAIGPHSIRLVTPGGVSNELYLHVHEEPVVAERAPTSETREESAQSAKGSPTYRKPQAVALPVVVNGSITRQGERDLYAFEATEGAELVFEVLLSRETMKKGFRPQVTLFDPTGSWFDPQKLTRMNFHTEVLEGATPITSGMLQRFEKAGTYVVEVVSERFKGAPDYAYSLRVVEAARRYRRYGAEPRITERVFARRLSPDRVAHLWTRAVAPELQSEASETIKIVAEQEPNNTVGEAMRITVPMLIEGAISQPGDVDRFTFSLDGDHRIAFEIETTGAQPPHFYPRVEIIDSIGRTMLTNVRRVDMPKSQRWDLRALEPKIIQRFEYGGTFSVEVRDVTSRAGGQDFTYRLMIRPQVPHVGDITVSTVKRGYEDSRFDPYRINLAPGEAKTVVVTVPIEEIANEVVEPGGARRFLYGSGELALLVENLPPGVNAYAGSFVENTRDTDMETVKKYYLLPDSELATIILEADRDAPAPKSPRGIRVVARTIVDDRPAARVVAGELPLMVVAGAAVTASADDASNDKPPESDAAKTETKSVATAGDPA
ncbi:MAG: hypothetical protein MK538_19425, partial [Planctomycetes bacterium]|nr:hypothetical protein [Planctomycetota bacterium]